MADAEGGNGDARPRKRRPRAAEPPGPEPDGAEADPARAERHRRACCMISEMLEEAGFDRRRARALKRQMLEGMILLCRWQLDRMAEHDVEPERPRRKGPQRVAVE